MNGAWNKSEINFRETYPCFSFLFPFIRFLKSQNLKVRENKSAWKFPIFAKINPLENFLFSRSEASKFVVQNSTLMKCNFGPFLEPPLACFYKTGRWYFCLNCMKNTFSPTELLLCKLNHFYKAVTRWKHRQKKMATLQIYASLQSLSELLSDEEGADKFAISKLGHLAAPQAFHWRHIRITFCMYLTIRF